jgi:hypothetical protein
MYFWLRKIIWVALALFMPEFVLFSAWEQRHLAVTLVEEFSNAVAEGIAERARRKGSDMEAKDEASKARNGEAANEEVNKEISLDEEIAQVGNERPKSVNVGQRVTEVGDVTMGSEGGKSETQVGVSKKSKS